MATVKKHYIDAIHIGGEDYQIEWNKAELERLGAGALADNVRHKILLDPMYRPYKMMIFKHLMHEAFHLVEQLTSTRLEEEVLDRFARAVAVMLVESGIVNLDSLEIRGKNG